MVTSARKRLPFGNQQTSDQEAQEKFQNPHFGFKKGNNWDFKGISLGKPKIGKVLPKPSMGF